MTKSYPSRYQISTIPKRGYFEPLTNLEIWYLALYDLLVHEKRGKKMEVQTMSQCVECGRVFDLTDEIQAGEFYYGHDCEEK